MAKQVRRKKLTKDEEMAAYEEMVADKPKNPIIEQYKVNLKCKTSNQKILSNLIKEKEVVICSGPAGSGKTYVTCSVALELLKNDPRYKKIIIVKSVTTLKDEEIGYIKGTVKEKMEPYVYSFIHNFNKIIGESSVSQLRDGNYIQELPIAFIRGINIDNAIVIIDETQNINIDNVRTIMTRLGENAKMIFLGDENQIDMRKKNDSSLQFIINKFELVDEIGTIRLTDDDIVRNPLIKKIEQIFKEN